VGKPSQNLQEPHHRIFSLSLRKMCVCACVHVCCVPHLAAPLVEEDRARDVVEQLERLEALLGVLPLEQLLLEVELPSVRMRVT
jgi:hypothetical protein